MPEQGSVIALLQKSLGAGRLAHGYLFSGEEMGAMEQVALTLAKTLNCMNPPLRSPEGHALDCCDECPNCRRIAGKNHPDVMWTQPESKSRQITIHQMRDVMNTIALKPGEAAYKISIIIWADRMNRDAANSFLKTLEEPPPRSIIILLTTAFEQLLETIVSRCLRLHFPAEAFTTLAPEEQSWLESLAASASTPAKSLIGRYKLLGLITKKLAGAKETTKNELEAASPLNRYPDAEKNQKDQWEDELNAAIESEYRRKRAETLLLLEWWMRDVWMACMKMRGEMLNLPQLKESTLQVASRISPAEATENLKVLERLQRLLRSNVQETLALEIGLLKLRL